MQFLKVLILEKNTFVVDRLISHQIRFEDLILEKKGKAECDLPCFYCVIKQLTNTYF